MLQRGTPGWTVRLLAAPYLHDGRATTITEAIPLNQADKDKLIAFLYSLRTPLTSNTNNSPDGKPFDDNCSWEETFFTLDD